MTLYGKLPILARRPIVVLAIVFGLIASGTVSGIVAEDLRAKPVIHAYLVPPVIHEHVKVLVPDSNLRRLR